MNVIKIGHGAYPRDGANGLRLCFSAASAVRVLMARGVPRAHARRVVKEVLSKAYGYTTISVGCLDVIEVQNEQWAVEEGHYWGGVKEQRRWWSKQPEW